jgi:hypothetical protein
MISSFITHETDSRTMHFDFSSGRSSSSKRFVGAKSAVLHSLHYADANDVETSDNRRFISAIGRIYRYDTEFQLGYAISTFVDFIIESRKLQRHESWNEIRQISDLNLRIGELLMSIPLQLWPLPHKNRCLCFFCDETPDILQIEEYLRQ